MTIRFVLIIAALLVNKISFTMNVTSKESTYNASNSQNLLYNATGIDITGIQKIISEYHNDGWLQYHKINTPANRRIACSSDSKLLAVGSDNYIELYNTANFNCLISIIDTCKALTFSGNDKHLAYVTTDDRIKIFDIYNSKLLKNIRTTQNEITDLVYSKDTGCLASGAWGSIKIWNKSYESVKVHDVQYRSKIVFSPNGKYLAAAIIDILQIFDMNTHQILHKIENDNGRIMSVVYSHDNKFLAYVIDKHDTFAGIVGYILKILDGNTYKLLHSLDLSCGNKNIDRGSLLSLSYSIDNKHLFLCVESYGKASKIVIDTSNYNIEEKLSENEFGHILFSPDNKFLFSSGHSINIYSNNTLLLPKLENEIKVANAIVVLKGADSKTNESKTKGLESISKLHGVGIANNTNSGCSTDSKKIAISDSDNKIFTTSKQIKEWNWDRTFSDDEKITKNINSIAFSSDGKYLATGALCHEQTVPYSSNPRTGILKLWKIDQDIKLSSQFLFRGDVKTLSFSPSGNYLAVGDRASYVYIFDFEKYIGDNTTHLIEKKYNHEEAISSVAFSKCGKYLASASLDKSIIIYSMNNNDFIQYFNFDSEVLAVDWSADGKYIAAGFKDNSVFICDVKTKKIAFGYSHDSQVNSVCFSPCGNYLASCSVAIMIYKFDVKSQSYSLLRNLAGHTGSVTSLAFVQSGKYLVSGSNDKTIRILDLDNIDHCYLVIAHENPISAVAFCPKTMTLATAGIRQINLYS